jgi:outer membrane protein OmpA-like peptidoglycan-associated protein
VPDSAAPPPPAVPLGSFLKRKLPGGFELNIPENGMENKLLNFIEDPSRPVDKTTWFDFDRLLFAPGSASLEPASTEQLTNIAAILQAFPKVDIRIGGYTDNTGDPAVNLTLSQERATTVMGELAKLDVDPSRMDAKGYGEEHPVADNATEAGRTLNRRISLRVTAK